ncbi:FUSC family protein [Acidocella aromatica]|uniref:Putative membrane protein YccC n=1 Tax=Acidocella aromatica TaxID=1303579 RepID=A0A840V8X0_9PROT|nr:FUSC family protein [Acidocella aromatica]MBB5372153.1 putative membrane protein YccC [Acidocella aromatica]
MSSTVHTRAASSPWPIDRQKFLFTLSSYTAAAITLGIAFAVSLPRPWWALLTIYVTAQPMSGAFRPKVLYRLAGIAIGGFVAILTVPNLQNAPVLLVPLLAGWIGLCLYFAVLDRTPRAFLFQMAGFSSAVLTFPYLDDPGNIFFTTVSRVEEMAVAIVAVTLTHAVIKPWPVGRMVQKRAETFLRDAALWASDVLGTDHGKLEQTHLKRLATDITELGMIALHLPYDANSATLSRRLVWAVQERLARLLPLASAAANRLALLRRADALGDDVSALLAAVSDWLAAPDDTDAAPPLAAKFRALAHHHAHAAGWTALLTASLCERMAECVEALREARLLVRSMGGAPADENHRLALMGTAPRRLHIERDHTLAILSGLATAAALVLYCIFWIMLNWPSGSTTAAFAAIITCSFAVQEDPAPQLRRYLTATLLTYPLAALYNFVILPCIDGYMLLIAFLAPAFLWLGYLQADPARAAFALPMFSCLIVGLDLLDRYQADFGIFMNTSCNQLLGIVMAVVVTRLFRSVGTSWVARRMIRNSWRDLAALAASPSRQEAGAWTSRAVDRLGQIAARITLAEPGDPLRSFQGLAELRLGRNLLHLRRALGAAKGGAHTAFGQVLEETAAFFRARYSTGAIIPPASSFLHAIDHALGHAGSVDDARLRHQAVLALVGMRCNLFPAAPAYVAGAT